MTKLLRTRGFADDIKEQSEGEHGKSFLPVCRCHDGFNLLEIGGEEMTLYHAYDLVVCWMPIWTTYLIPVLIVALVATIGCILRRILVR